MAVLALPWFILSAYCIDRHEFCHYVIQRDDAFISRLIEAEKNFWEQYIEKDVMPAPSGIDAESEMTTDVFEGSTASIILDEQAESLSAEYLLINQQLKDLEDKKKQIASTIKLKIIEQQNGNGEAKVRAIAGKYLISFSKSLRKSIDSEKLKKDGLYDAYCTKSETSNFSITEQKT